MLTSVVVVVVVVVVVDLFGYVIQARCVPVWCMYGVDVDRADETWSCTGISQPRAVGLRVSEAWPIQSCRRRREGGSALSTAVGVFAGSTLRTRQSVCGRSRLAGRGVDGLWYVGRDWTAEL
ncbi:hypothetical protein QBC45DRAFT_207114 [Copromyces sp. CBS 386.78]|nr:hypothetical protein QBC45DRAFT_207114 [Copromyces sp. CBS 386.78]